MPTYQSEYPPAQNSTYVKATSEFNTSFKPYFTTDPTKSLTGDWTNNQWVSQNAVNTNQRFHIDLGSAKVIKRFYYENGHDGTGTISWGAKDFTLWGSNDSGAFNTLTYSTDTNWTQITTSQSTLDQHTASNVPDPKYITLTNSTAYRYYAFKFANTYPAGNSIAVRRIELQTEVLIAPTVTTSTPAGSIDSNSATGGGNVTDGGNSTVTERGIAWGTSTNPTIAGDHQASGSGTGVFGPVSMTGLDSDTHYYYRAYATNEAGTAYGANVEFDTIDAVISGTCTLAGSPVAGAIVTLIDSATDTVVATDTSDGSGNYAFNGLDVTKTYHVVAEYEDSPDQYNAKSLPFMTPEEI